MKRFLLFNYMDHEQGGGWHDLAGDFDSLEEARTHRFEKPRNEPDVFHIVDLTIGEIVDSGYRLSNGKEYPS